MTDRPAGNGAVDQRIDGDLGETNRGVGQERVGERQSGNGPGPRQASPFDSAAGGPGTGAGTGTKPAPPSGATQP